MAKRNDGWVRTFLMLVSVFSLCAGAGKYLAADPASASLRCFVPAGITTIFFFASEFLQHIVSILPQYELSTWLSVLLILLGFGVLGAGMLQSDKESRNNLFTFAGAVFGLGSGIPIGKATVRHTPPRNGRSP